MSRQRWWCSFCGQLTERHPDPDGKVRCNAHSALPREDGLIPPDPLTRLPLMADELSTGAGETRPGGTRGYDRVPLSSEGSAHTATGPAPLSAPMREDTHPARERGD